ncbi:fungal specific transcription factor domain-containing protein [Cladophialophora carrionii]|uniref:Fungal specific transcription factor domain-containing protein n=1 Tax=Cladophialophora carrionii TaxID=86049 RepID=A0A1C1C7N6_9EURO|nr:fungal specific transcription factor domain-containing protein [Cladophialophora carrionii]
MTEITSAPTSKRIETETETSRSLSSTAASASAPESNLRVTSERADIDPTSVSTEQSQSGSYLGRAEYLVPIDEEDAKKYTNDDREVIAPEIDLKLLEALRVFELPTRSIRDSLVSDFMQRCRPWMPIVDLADLQKVGGREPSTLLLQAVFVAGSRVSMAPQAQSLGSIYYQRARTLYFCRMEKDPLTIIRATCILQWWNPRGPEHVSMDASSFWLHMGVALAHQVGLHREPNPRKADAGLRRRLWWTLVARDCLIAMSHGRPRAINEEDSDVRPLSLEDFPEPDFDAKLFIEYVKICSILGALIETAVRGTQGKARRLELEANLSRWIRELPPELRIYNKDAGELAAYNFKARQLHVPYFTALTILFRSPSHGTGPPPSAAALLSSSFSAGIFEEFLSRGEIPLLAPVFTFHLMAAAIAQLACYPYPALWTKAQPEVDVIEKCLIEMARRYPTAIGAQRVVSHLSRAFKEQERHDGPLHLAFSTDQIKFFQWFGRELCNIWDLIFPKAGDDGISAMDLRQKVYSTHEQPRENSNGANVPVDDPTAHTSIILQDPSQFLNAFSMAPTWNNEHFQNGAIFDSLSQMGDESTEQDGLHLAQHDPVGRWMIGDWSTRFM